MERFYTWGIINKLQVCEKGWKSNKGLTTSVFLSFVDPIDWEFGFDLKADDTSLPANLAMLSLLRDAYINNKEVRIEYETESKDSKIGYIKSIQFGPSVVLIDAEAQIGGHFNPEDFKPKIVAAKSGGAKEIVLQYDRAVSSAMLLNALKEAGVSGESAQLRVPMSEASVTSELLNAMEQEGIAIEAGQAVVPLTKAAANPQLLDTLREANASIEPASLSIFLEKAEAKSGKTAVVAHHFGDEVLHG